LYREGESEKQHYRKERSGFVTYKSSFGNSGQVIDYLLKVASHAFQQICYVTYGIH